MRSALEAKLLAPSLRRASCRLVLLARRRLVSLLVSVALGCGIALCGVLPYLSRPSLARAATSDARSVSYWACLYAPDRRLRGVLRAPREALASEFLDPLRPVCVGNEVVRPKQIQGILQGDVVGPA